MRPIDADALIAEFEDYIKSNRSCGNSICVSVADVLTETIIDAPTIEQPTWISVDERLPTEGVSIEMFYPISQSICLGYYREIKKIPFWCVKFPDGTGRLGDEKPTHWRYRYIVDTPQPPKGVE